MSIDAADDALHGPLHAVALDAVGEGVTEIAAGLDERLLVDLVEAVLVGEQRARAGGGARQAQAALRVGHEDPVGEADRGDGEDHADDADHELAAGGGLEARVGEQRRLEPVAQRVPGAGDLEQAAHRGEHGQHGDRRGHRHAGVVRGVRVAALGLGAPEGPEEEAEHVEGRQARPDQADDGQHGAEGAGVERRREDLVLAEEAREGRDAGDGQAAHQHRGVGQAQVAAQAAHAVEALLAGQRVDRDADRRGRAAP